MRVEFYRSFERDLRAIRDQSLLDRLRAVIIELEEADDLGSIAGLTAMQGNPGYYRIRIGGYRMGIKKADSCIRIIRFLKRGDIYRKFP